MPPPADRWQHPRVAHPTDLEISGALPLRMRIVRTLTGVQGGRPARYPVSHTRQNLPGVRSTMPAQPQPIVIVPYDDAWPERFRELAGAIRTALGDLALRIDHIGSTSIPGLAAKPIIDIQISVASFEPFDLLRAPLEAMGYVWRADNTDLTKRYFRETGVRRERTCMCGFREAGANSSRSCSGTTSGCIPRSLKRTPRSNGTSPADTARIALGTPPQRTRSSGRRCVAQACGRRTPAGNLAPPTRERLPGMCSFSAVDD